MKRRGRTQRQRRFNARPRSAGLLAFDAMSRDRHAIASYATAFIGAQAALDELSQRRDAGARLLLLHGAPGVGKTRVAVEWARAYAARMGWRAALIELSSSRSLQDCVIAVCRALGVRLDGARLLDDGELTRWLCARVSEFASIVLVFDGADAASDALMPLLDALLPVSGAIAVVTQRAQRPDRAALVEVRPLRVPAPDASRDAVLRAPSVALFIDRARSIWRDYRPSGSELDSIASIVRALDGLPLAIELASARLAVVSATQLEPLVGASIDLLVAPDAGLALRAVIDHSWATLAPEQQRLLARLSLCEGGFDLPLATQLGVDRAADVATQQIACVDALHALVRRSLVEAVEHDGEDGGGRRFRVLEPIRMFAAAELAASGERAIAERAFVRAVLALPAPGLLGVESLDELRLMLREERNFRSALALALAHGDDASALRLLVSMSVHYRVHGPLPWWLSVEERLRPRFERLPDELQQDAAIARAQCLIAAGHSESAYEALQFLSSNARASRSVDALAWSLSKLAVVSALRGERARAAQFQREANALSAQCTEAVRLRVVRDEAWTLSRAGDNARSEALYREALALAERLDATYQLPSLLGFVGHHELDRGALNEAVAHLDASVAHAERCDDRRTRFANIAVLGLVYVELARYEEARSQLGAALEGHQRLGDRWHEAETRMYLGFLSLESGAHAEAERWFREASLAHEDTRDVASQSMAEIGRALACVELGDVESARALVGALETRAASLDRPAVASAITVARRALDVVRARLLAAEGSHAEAERIANELRAWLRSALAERPVLELRFSLRALLAIVDRLFARWQQGVRGARAVEVAFDGAFVRLEGVTVALAKASERRMLLALASASGASLSIDALFAAGWPGEKANADAKTNRVRVALTGLRRAGLRAVIERNAEGYRLSPDCVIELVAR